MFGLKRIQLSDTSLHKSLRGKLGRTTVFKDEPYAYEHWRRQQTWKRYMEPFDCTKLVIDIVWPVLLVATFAAGLGMYQVFGRAHYQYTFAPVIDLDQTHELQALSFQEKHGFPWFAENSNAVEYGIPFTTTSFAVALLLVFRTNESYRRWWDARRNIGRLCTSMRNLVRQGMAWFSTDDDGMALLEALSRWCITLPHMMLFHVCEGNDMNDILKGILRPNELDFLKAQERPTFGVVACMTFIVQAARLTDQQQQSMDADIRAAVQEFGGSDDILRQPLPTSYTRHTSRFLLVWLLCLPVAIWQVYGWASIFICSAVAFFLLGIEQIGIQIEEPFSVLPLDKIAARLHADINEMMEQMEAGKGTVRICLAHRHVVTAPGNQHMDVASRGAKLEIPSFNPKAAPSEALDVLDSLDPATLSFSSPGPINFAPQPQKLQRQTSNSSPPPCALQRQYSKPRIPDDFWDKPGHSRKSSSFSSQKSCNV